MRRAHGPRRAGQALVEFALLLPLLCLLILGIVEFARAWNAYQVVTDAAREGARLAVVDEGVIASDSVVRTVEGALARAGMAPSAATITLTGWRSGRGTPLTLSVQYQHQLRFLAPFVGWTGADASVALKSSSVMRNE